MRAVGYLMLIFGFLILFADGAMSREHAGAIVAWGDGKLAKQETFGRKEVVDAMSLVSFKARHSFTDLIIPSAAMLCGGVLLDVARRRKEQKGFNRS